MPLDPWNVFTANFGHMPHPYTAFATILDMLLFLAVSLKVAMARGKFKVAAPAITGPEEFNRIFRVQQNTLEQLMMHLPLLWIASFAMDDVFAAAFGAVWLFGRILYARGYYLKPKRRIKGFVIAMSVNAILMLCAIASVIASF